MNNEQKIKLIQKAIEDKTGKNISVAYNGDFIHFKFNRVTFWSINKNLLEFLPLSDPLEEQPDKGWIPHNYQYVSEKITKAKEADLICSKPGKNENFLPNLEIENKCCLFVMSNIVETNK